MNELQQQVIEKLTSNLKQLLNRDVSDVVETRIVNVARLLFGDNICQIPFEVCVEVDTTLSNDEVKKLKGFLKNIQTV